MSSELKIDNYGREWAELNPRLPILPPHCSPSESDANIRSLVPQPHQRQALLAIDTELERGGLDIRTQCILPCGTGKTLVEAETLLKHAVGQGQLGLMTEPSLALISQSLKTLKGRLPSDTRYLVICSDESVVDLNSDQIVVRKEDLLCDVTTSVDELAGFIRGTGPRVVMSTLHSTPLIADACKRSQGGILFKTAVIDEAHRTATHEESAFATVLNNNLIPIRERVFFTATPRVYHEDTKGSITWHSMDDVQQYGERCFTLSFRKAVEQRIICDYQVIVSAIPASRVRDDSDSGAVAEVALLDATKAYGLKKILSFHNSVNAAQRWSTDLEKVLTASPLDYFIASVNGKMPASTREGLMNQFRTGAPSGFSLLSSCRCLSEGVDIPEVSGILIDGKRDSELEAIQIFGRVIRQSPGKQIGTIILPVIVPEDMQVDEVLSKSNFKTVWRVITALASIDDEYEARCKIRQVYHTPNSSSGPGMYEASKTAPQLESKFAKNLSVRVAMTSLNLDKEPLNLSQIRDWITAYHDRYGKPPTESSGVVEGANITWAAISLALRSGGRGLQGAGYKSLPDLCTSMNLSGKKADFSLEQIREWITVYHEKNGKPPTRSSGNVEGTSETWVAIGSALRDEWRGLEGCGFRSLSDLCIAMRLKEKKADLSLEQIKAWITAYHEKNGKPPTENSGTVEGTKETWKAIVFAFRNKGRGLEGCGFASLFELCLAMGFTERKEELSLEQIKAWITSYYEKNSMAPTDRSGTVEGTGETWRAINSALRLGGRGLKGCGFASLFDLSIAMGLKERKEELSLEQIKAWITTYYEKNSKAPTDKSGTVEGTSETWRGLSIALRREGRGLRGCGIKSLSDLCIAMGLKEKSLG